MGACVDARAGPVIAEMESRHPKAASDAILSVPMREPGRDMADHIPRMARRAAAIYDPATVLGTILAAPDSDLEMSKRFRPALAELRRGLGGGALPSRASMVEHAGGTPSSHPRPVPRGGGAPNRCFIAATCLHALPVCANALHPHHHLPTTYAILYHSSSLDCDIASYS